MLTQALAKHIKAHGGEVHLSAPVEKILVEDGRAIGIQVDGQIYTARLIVAGTHALETFGKLLPPEHRPRGARKMRVGNGFGVMLRLALDSPICYQHIRGKRLVSPYNYCVAIANKLTPLSVTTSKAILRKTHRFLR
jgi:phytoene dehydrogenase-like protein